MQAGMAYFILAHHRPQQLRWLVEALAHPNGSSRDTIILHVDRKSMLGLKAERRGIWQTAKALAAEYPNVVVMRPRFTNWGGWSLARIQLDAIAMALEASPDWSHFVNLSGQCYPIKPIEQIRQALAADPDQVFVELRHLSTLPADDWHLRWHPMLELPHRAVKFKGPRRPPGDFELAYKGSQWSILPRAFCEWQQRAPIAKPIRHYLSRLLLSDELIMQTLVRNGPWRDKVAPHFGREIIFPGPKVLTQDDMPRLTRSPALYARKFDQQRDPEILPQLARQFGYPMSRAPLGEAAMHPAPTSKALAQ